ncbi:AraC family transcriptional regulator, partial [Parabacteroides distasonis]
MENDIPKIDLPDDWIIGNLSHKDIGLLSLYANYPCRLKAEIFVLCMQGEIEASINLTRYQVKPGSFITILPGTILQIHKVEGDLQIYFMGFSSEFTNHANIGKSAMDMLYVVKDSPIIELKEQPAQLLKDYFSLLVKTYGFCGPKLNKDILNHLLSGVLLGVGAMYKDKTLNKTNLSKAEQISKNFGHLVMQNYTTQRSVAWYAKKLGITPAHLS